MLEIVLLCLIAGSLLERFPDRKALKAAGVVRKVP
jgi:hypothetical protein